MNKLKEDNDKLLKEITKYIETLKKIQAEMASATLYRPFGRDGRKPQ